MMASTTSAYITQTLSGTLPELVGEEVNNWDGDSIEDEPKDSDEDELQDSDDIAPIAGPKALTSVTFPSQPGMFSNSQQFFLIIKLSLFPQIVWKYPKILETLAAYIKQPQFPIAFHKFLFTQHHPQSEMTPANLEEHAPFYGKIYLYHSAVAQFYAPSDLCSTGRMHCEYICCNLLWCGEMACCDTVLVSVHDFQYGIYRMLVTCVLLFFSFHDVYLDKDIPCALVNWFIPNGDEPDELTRMWVVETEHEGNTHMLEVIHLDTIVRGTHLLLLYGSAFLLEDFHYSVSLDVFKFYFVNHYIDQHAHKSLT
jgi:hypothetical protein